MVHPCTDLRAHGDAVFLFGSREPSFRKVRWYSILGRRVRVCCGAVDNCLVVSAGYGAIYLFSVLGEKKMSNDLLNSAANIERGRASYVFAFFIGILIILAAFQSSALVSLSYDLPQSNWAERAVAVTETWHGWMQAIGVAGITEVVSAWIEKAHDLTISLLVAFASSRKHLPLN